MKKSYRMCFMLIIRGGLGRLAAWHLPGGPFGQPARWAAASNVGGRGTKPSGP